MSKFRKLPVIIEAVQYTEDMASAVIAGEDAPWGLAPQMVTSEEGCPYRTGRLLIATLEGTMLVSPGDWVITGVKGEKYPCKPGIFEATYERVYEPDRPGGEE